mmetsp:Transcript_54843/g.160036  ORF Transcript_54843/g.160036 Transcript_54843/m.160036 type:complete len:202 (+) Transcript_54843:1290-1895(+)
MPHRDLHNVPRRVLREGCQVRLQVRRANDSYDGCRAVAHISDGGRLAGRGHGHHDRADEKESRQGGNVARGHVCSKEDVGAAMHTKGSKPLSPHVGGGSDLRIREPSELSICGRPGAEKRPGPKLLHCLNHQPPAIFSVHSLRLGHRLRNHRVLVHLLWLAASGALLTCAPGARAAGTVEAELPWLNHCLALRAEHQLVAL